MAAMYLEHYGLLEAPFSIAPDPRYLYMSERHREALAHLLYGMESDGAFILLTGDVGTGKTTVSRCLLEQVPDNTHLALVLNPKLSSIELLQVICDELRIGYEKTDLSVKTLVDYLNRYLLAAHAQGKKTVVLIEEAQNLDLDVLEQLRLLTNLETNERKLMQVILLGQPEFLDVLDRPELSQLAQRITARFHLSPLKLNEVEEYVSHRLAIAGCRRPLFARGVIKLLYNYSGGVPRLINVICDRALLGCYVQNRHQVDKPTLISAAKEVLGRNKAATIKSQVMPRYKNMFALAFVVICLIAITSYFFDVKLKRATDVDESVSEPVEQKKNLQTPEIQPDISQPQEMGIINDPLTVNVVTEAPGNRQSLIEQAVIKWPESDQRLSSNLQAYQTLFELWQLSYNLLTDGTPCYFAQTQGLSCLHEQSDMQSLRLLNRPAILTLYDDSNQLQYATLMRINEDMAEIVLSGVLHIIPLKQLESYWRGDFSLFWRIPPGYSEVIRPGDTGDVVLWLRKKMNNINGYSQADVRAYYDEELVKQVKDFQLREGLKSDGVVGLKTLIRINQIIHKATPLLEES
ncbi:MAG: AAA family ATPase [Gammaproteobacteria bacterium]|nr:AAA family ATPase [Gammaproteobacteria bacterium]